MSNALGRFTTGHPWLVCILWVIAGSLLTLVAPAWDTQAQDDDIHFLPARCASVRGYLLLQKAFPQDVFASRAIFAIERDQPLSAADFTLVDQLVADLTQLSHEEPALPLGAITSYRHPLLGKRLVSGDGCCTLIQVSLSTPFLALQTRAAVDRAEARLQPRLVQAGPGAPRLLVTGAAGLGRDLVRAGAGGLEGTTLATVALVVVVLLLVYRAPLLALVPLLTIGCSVWVALQLLALLTLLPGVHLVNISKVFAIVILYGAGIDYCLFLISRYKEELTQAGHRTVAIRRSIGAVGGALVASAGTVICGLGMMGFAEFAKIRCAGPAIALSLAVALAAALTLTPALLQILGRAVFWPGREPTSSLPVRLLRNSPRLHDREAFWERISRVVVARPALVWLAAVSLLLPLALFGMRVAPDYRSTSELPPTSSSIRGVAAIQRHFTAGEIGPLTVLLTSANDWNSPEGRALVAHLSRGLGNLPNVAEVRSFTQPLGLPLPPPPAIRPSDQGFVGGLLKSLRQGIVQEAEQAARAYFVSAVPGEAGTDSVTRLDVVFGTDPFDAASLHTLDLVQTWLDDELPRAARALVGVRPELYGVTIGARDLAEVTEADRDRVNLLVLGGVFVILLALVRKLWLATYLLATVLLSYYATLGATVLMSHWWSGRPLDQVEWRVPFFLFTILVAVGEDYNILLITRVLQERRLFGDKEGIRRALARTGGTITSCGLIMAGTFATLMLTGLGTLMQIGFALAFGVLLDTFVVRPFLVPAFALLVWRTGAPAQERSAAAPLPTRRAG